MIAIRRLPAEEGRRLLDHLQTVAEDRFGGLVERPFVTVLFTGRRP